MELRTRRSASGSSRSWIFDAILRLPLMVLALSCLYAHTDSETSHYTWRLDGDKVMPGSTPNAPGSYPNSALPPPQPPPATPSESGDNDTANKDDKVQEDVLEILLSTDPSPDGTWKKTWTSSRYCSRCQRHFGSGTNPDAPISDPVIRNNRGIAIAGAGSDEFDEDGTYFDDDPDNLDLAKDQEVLDCGRPVNFTYYDHLVGIQNRASHPHIPEPEVALTFQKSGVYKPSRNGGKKTAKNNSNEINIDDIERSLLKAKREKPKSVELYNQIGNFWRIRGDTQKSIECFRRALAVSPNNADILLNLARVLFNLEYLDDAIVLTRRSLEVQPPDQNAWAQHFQLGEILKAYCHYQEAALHLRHVLELKPNYGPALSALADMEAMPDSTVHIYTLLIIVFLVLAVLGWILSTLDISLEELIGFSFNAKDPSQETSSNGHHHNHKFNRQLQRLRNKKFA